MSEQRSEDKVKDSIQLIRDKRSCQEATDWWNERRDYTLLDLAKEYLAAKDTPASWAAWYLGAIGDRASLEIRKCMIAKITDPTEAYCLLKTPSVFSKEESEILVKTSGSKPPTLEQITNNEVAGHLEDALLRHCWADLSTEQRDALLSKVTSPMRAFTYYLDLPNLDSREDEILRRKFEGKLPTAEQELRDGVVSRTKGGN